MRARLPKMRWPRQVKRRVVAEGVSPARHTETPMQHSTEGITRQVSAMYDLFPYPNPEKGTKALEELSNLLAFFSQETGYDFRGKTVLDAGTGTGQRLLEAAASLKETTFLAIDVSGRPLAIAREVAREAGVENVRFRRADLMDTSAHLGRFDVILCMGVLNQLADPQRGMRNLVRSLAPNGMLFFYIHGSLGSHERMRRKRIVSTLLGNSARDFDRGIEMVNDLGFDSLCYGWNLNTEDERTKESVCVHSYLNAHESLFDADGLFRLVKASGLGAFMTYRITVGHTDLLFETRLNAPRETILRRTEVAQKLSTPLLSNAYERLSLRDRYRLIDLIYQPNGYLVVGMKAGSEKLFDHNGRVWHNTVRVASDWTSTS
jgi:SAM-dependent methyltransferase